MVNIHDRLKRLETASAPSRAERWRADMARAQDGLAEIDRKIGGILEEHGIDPDNLPPQTPEEHDQAAREVRDAIQSWREGE